MEIRSGNKLISTSNIKNHATSKRKLNDKNPTSWVAYIKWILNYFIVFQLEIIFLI